MRKKLFFITILLFILTLPANAVLQEDSLKNSLQVLRHELIAQHLEQTKQLNKSRFITEQVTNHRRPTTSLTLPMLANKQLNYGKTSKQRHVLFMTLSRKVTKK